jgi:hypothetical protein
LYVWVFSAIVFDSFIVWYVPFLSGTQSIMTVEASKSHKVSRTSDSGHFATPAFPP